MDFLWMFVDFLYFCDQNLPIFGICDAFNVVLFAASPGGFRSQLPAGLLEARPISDDPASRRQNEYMENGGFMWFYMVLYGFMVVLYGFIWFYMVLYGFMWFYGGFMMVLWWFYGILWDFMGCTLW